MFSFHSELRKLILLKEGRENQQEKRMNILQEKIISYLKKEKDAEWLKEFKLLFSACENLILVREYQGNILNPKVIAFEAFENEDDARIALIFLEQHFKNEGYQVLKEKTALEDGMFNVKFTDF